MSDVTFKIGVPTDGEGFLGRQCNNPECGRYFKVFLECIRQEMFCPYCGIAFSSNELYTAEQLRYLRKAALEKAREYVFGEFDKTFGDLARHSSGNRFVQIKHTPIRYKAKRITPRYKERDVDSEISCPECGFRFQVYGVFGFCPGCRAENMRVYDAYLTTIRDEIEQAGNNDRALRHAYSDLVSTFQIFCNKRCLAGTENKPSFQELYPTRGFFKKSLSIDIFAGLSESEILVISRVFQKRHVGLHADGMITEKYVRKIPQDRSLLGTKARLSLQEFEEAAKVLRKVIDNLSKATEPK